MITKHIDLIKPKKFFQGIDAEAILHKRKQRTIKTANLDEPAIISYSYGQYRYFDEQSGKYKYFTEPLPNVSGKMRHDNDTIVNVTKPVLKNEMTIKYAAEQGRELLNLSTVASTVWRWIGRVDIDDEAYKQMEKQTIDKSSGHGSIDEVYDNGDGILILTDPVCNLILFAYLYCSNICNNQIIDALKKIKDKGISLFYCVRDGSVLYINTIQKVFSTIKLQICIFHLIKGLLKYFHKWHKQIRNEIKTNKLPRGQKGEGRKLKQFVFRKRTIFVTKNPNEKEKDLLSKFIDALPEFKKLREMYLKFMLIFESKTRREAENRFWDFIAEPLVSEKMPGLEKQLLKYYKRNELFSYLDYSEDIWKKIRTSNHTERTNRKFRKKQKTHYRIRKTKRRSKVLKFMMFYHNTMSLGMNTKNVLVVLPMKRALLFIFFQRL